MKVVVLKEKNIQFEATILDNDIVNGGELFIGRGNDCHIILDSQKISRHHAVLTFNEGNLLIKSLSDYGFIKVNGEEVASAYIQNGSKIEIDSFDIEVSQFNYVPTTGPGLQTQIMQQAQEETMLYSSEVSDETDMLAPQTAPAAVASVDPMLDDELLDATEMLDGDIGDASAATNENAFENSEGVMVRDDTYPVMGELDGELDGDLDGDLGDDLGDDLGGDDLGGDALGDDFDDDFNQSDPEHTLQEIEETQDFNADDDLGGDDLGGDSFGDDDEDDTHTADNFAGSEDETNTAADNFDEDGEANFGDDGDFGGDEDFGGDDDFGGGDDDFGGGDFGGDEGSKTQVFQSFASFNLKIFGEYAPFDSYKLEDPLTKIGRDHNECQIILNDPEVSKVHAIIKKNLIGCTLEDNDSSNGIIFNGERVNKAELTNGDEFIIGETTFTVAIVSDLLESEKGRLMPIEENQEVIIEDDTPDDIDFNEGEGGLDFNDPELEVEEEKSIIKKIMKDPKKRLYAIAGILILGMVLIDTPEPGSEPKEDDKKPKQVVPKTPKEKPKYSAEKLQVLQQNYELALAKYKSEQYSEAKEYIKVVESIDPKYKLTESLSKSIQESLDAIAREEERRKKEEERLLKIKKIKELVDRAKEAVKEKNVAVARTLFNQIYELDPENIDVPPLKIELDAYLAEIERKKQEEALKKQRRRNMESKLKPGKDHYTRQEWYEAVIDLERFLTEKDMDEDLVISGRNMLQESRKKLVGFIQPLLSKARSFKEGQDLKQAYETYGEVLKYDPANEEALNERGEIFEELYKRSKKVFREALIKEDLSDFANAKEKFEEVKQISPINSEYYNKATEKLKNYLE